MKTIKQIFLLAAGAVVVLLLSACGGQKPAEETPTQDKLQVFTVSYAVTYFAEKLAGEDALVLFPAPADADPAYWQPDIDTIVSYQQADLILLNGAGYARWLRQTSLPGDKLVDTSAAYIDELIATTTGPTHSHGPEGEHEHVEPAFTTWLDLGLAQQQLSTVTTALQALMPTNSAVLGEREARLGTELAEIDEAMSRAADKLRGTPVLFSHPVYQYFERRYGLTGRSVHWEPDKAPTAEQWQALAGMLAEHPVQYMIWEDTPLPEVQQRLEAIGVDVIVIRTAATRPAQGDFLSIMRANVEALENRKS